MIKRWIIDTSCECGRFGDDVNAWEDKDGEWVKYEDIKHLLQNTSPNSDYVKCLAIVGDELKVVGLEGVDGFIKKIWSKHFA